MTAIRLTGLLAIAVAGVAVYSNTLGVPFIFDDVLNILDNRHVRMDRFDVRALGVAALHSPNPRPVAMMSFAINHWLGGYDVAGYHVTNTVIHVINGLLVYALASLTLRRARAFGGRDGPDRRSIAVVACLAALIFTAHPIQTQAVTYTVQRMTSLAATGYLLCLVLYVAGRETTRTWKRWSLWGGALASGVLALGSKQTAATLPAGVLLYEWFFFRDLSRDAIRRNLRSLLAGAALLLLLALFCLGRHPLERILVGYEIRDFTLTERVITQPRVVLLYFSLLCFPHPARLNLLHHVPTSTSLVSPAATLPAITILIVLAFAGVVLARRHRIISFCILWVFLQLVIESSVIGLEMAFEHRMYLPMFGFALAVSCVLTRLAARLPVAAALGVAAVVVLGAAAHQRNRAWQDELGFWSDVVVKSVAAHRPHVNMGVAMARAREYDRSIASFRRAVEIKDDDVKTHFNLGVSYRAVGAFDDSIRHLRRALEIDDTHEGARTHLKWVLATHPEAARRDPRDAVE